MLEIIYMHIYYVYKSPVNGLNSVLWPQIDFPKFSTFSIYIEQFSSKFFLTIYIYTLIQHKSTLLP